MLSQLPSGYLAMGDDPFTDSLPIENGDFPYFPWLC